MREFFLNLVEKTWLKPKSIPVAFLLLSVTYVALITAVSEWDGVTLTATMYHIVAIAFALAWLAYSTACIFFHRLKRAPKDCLAVLFCIEAESPKLFAAAESKLVSNFTASLGRNSSIKFKALCVSKDRISRYDLKRDEDCLRLLEKTRAVILVDVQYRTDDVDNPEYFVLKINYGVRHPEFNETAEKALVHDIGQLGSPLRDRRFEKRETIDVFEFSTQALVFACQYIIGFVLLLTGDGQHSSELLKQARRTAENNSGKGFDTERLTCVVDDRLFAAYIRMAQMCVEKFQKYSLLECLSDAEGALELANDIHPETYSYNLLKAYILVMLHQDGIAAKKCVEKCKQSNLHQDWTYSDAFLCAYAGNTPGHVISKYNKAFKALDMNLVELADYIEIVCAREPDRLTLHLALGILYCRMGNNKLARCHLILYLDRVKIANAKDREKVNALIQSAECDDSCDHNCISCSSLEAG